MNTYNQPGPLTFVAGTGTVPQIVLGLLLPTVLYIILMSLEMVYLSFKAVTGTRVDIIPMTVNAQNKPREYEQDPNSMVDRKNKKLLPLSDNERTGAEFSYAFFLWIDPSSFKSEQGLLHILHKGHPVPYPLMGPGVFLHSNSNSLRVYMNTSSTWNNYVDVENIPVKKWVHVVVMARNNCIEVYINGNITKKLTITDGVLYQNFGNLYVFNQRPVVLNPSLIQSLNGESMTVFGSYMGNLSNLYYFSYALSYTEIQGIISEGPSRKTESNSEDAPPYLEDSWWTTNYNK